MFRDCTAADKLDAPTADGGEAAFAEGAWHEDGIVIACVA